MVNLAELVNAAVRLEPREQVVDGWSAVHLITQTTGFGGKSFDYEGYLILTTRRLLFVSALLLTPIKLIPSLCFRLDDIVDVEVSGRELSVGRQRFKILGGVQAGLVQNQIRQAIFERLQEAKMRPRMNEVLRPETAERYRVPERAAAPRERVKLVQCPSCGVWNASDLDACESCGKRVPS
jgi:hypothetical protein